MFEFMLVFFVAICFIVFVKIVAQVGKSLVIVPDYEQKYEAVLRQIKNDPNNSELRMEVRRLGKWLVANAPEKYSEQSLTNDLLAVTGGRLNGAGVVKVEITNPEKLHPVDVAEQVEKLGQLFLKGVITAEEFERGKALFLGSPPDVAKKTLETLDDLYRLQQKGALSEAEYNMKKWDLLSGKLIK
ncbi:MAG: SHOCT domain-containing protein [Planctomycetaceae bacterium]|nr:SHOCT domain-containing protein [Planctomycetaceae bacterium]